MDRYIGERPTPESTHRRNVDPGCISKLGDNLFAPFLDPFLGKGREKGVTIGTKAGDICIRCNYIKGAASRGLFLNICCPPRSVWRCN